MSHFPNTNKYPQVLSPALANIEMLAERVSATGWKRSLLIYATAFAVFLFTLFMTVLTVRFALWL